MVVMYYDWDLEMLMYVVMRIAKRKMATTLQSFSDHAQQLSVECRFVVD